MAEVRVQGLTRLDSLDLKRQFPDAVIAFEEADSADPWHGELATVAVVTITLAGLNALANWLLKDRRKQEVVKTVVITDADRDNPDQAVREHQPAGGG
jgi:hypothetical protein